VEEDLEEEWVVSVRVLAGPPIADVPSAGIQNRILVEHPALVYLVQNVAPDW
jgi:hypothetical protein